MKSCLFCANFPCGTWEYYREEYGYTSDELIAEECPYYVEDSVGNAIRELEKQYGKDVLSEEGPSREELEFYKTRGLRGWEMFFVPEKWFYSEVLKHLSSSDVVFDVGAGDLRFDLIMSRYVRKVYAVEVNPIILAKALKIVGYRLPRNIIVICANALDIPLPEDVTAITILMQHRTWQIPEQWHGRKIIYTTREGVKVAKK